MHDHVALYWDFENLTYSKTRGRGAPVDLDRIQAYAATHGRLTINRAYANWNQHQPYWPALKTATIDLVQLFPLGRGKNGADIRLAADAAADCARDPSIRVAVIVTGDADFVGLAVRLRSLGVTVVGVGRRASANKHWMRVCDHYAHYEDLPKGPGASGGASRKAPSASKQGATDLSAAKALLLRTFRATFTSDDGVNPGELKSKMCRDDESFDHQALGFPSFRGFIEAVAADALEIGASAENPKQQVVWPRDASIPSAAPVAPPPPPQPQAAPTSHDLTPADLYDEPETRRVLIDWILQLDTTTLWPSHKDADVALRAHLTKHGETRLAASTPKLRGQVAGAHLINGEDGANYRPVTEPGEVATHLLHWYANRHLAHQPGTFDLEDLAQQVFPDHPELVEKVDFPTLDALKLGGVRHRTERAVATMGIRSPYHETIADLQRWMDAYTTASARKTRGAFATFIEDELDVPPKAAERLVLLAVRVGLLVADPTHEPGQPKRFQVRPNAAASTIDAIVQGILDRPALAEQPRDEALADALVDILGLEDAETAAAVRNAIR